MTTDSELENRLAGIPRYEGSNLSLSAIEQVKRGPDSLSKGVGTTVVRKRQSGPLMWELPRGGNEPGMNAISATRLGYDVSAITDQLFIAARPRSHHVEEVRGLGVDVVLSMIWVAPPRELTRPPFRLMRLPTIDFPLFPIPLFMLRRGVAAAVPVMDAGGRVLIYCLAGRHRSVAMASCILIARGMTADDAMDVIVSQRPVADPHAPHIERRIRAFERDLLRRRRSATTPTASSH